MFGDDETSREWHYLDHGLWMNRLGEFTRMPVNPLGDRELELRERADWTFVGDGLWCDGTGALEEITLVR